MGRAARVPAARQRAFVALGALLLFMMTLVVYVPSMRGGFVWDDDDNVTKNMTLRTWHGLARIWSDPRSTQQYYPLTHSSFWVQYQIWGLRPFPYHLANVVLHAAGAMLLWFTLRRLAVPGAWLAAGVFAVHPVHVESVAWVTERKNVLAGVFFLGAMLAYIGYAGLDREAPGGAKESAGKAANRGLYAVALLLAIGAVLAKSVTSSLPAVLLAVVWWKKGRLGWRDLVPTIPMFAVGIAMGSMTYWLEKHHVGAVGREWDLSPPQMLIVAGRVMWFYAGKLLWPAHLIFIYPRWRIDSSQLWQYIFPVGAAAVLVGLFLQRTRIGRGPFTAVFIFVLALVPASGFFNVFFMRYSYVQDHFQYFASMALITLLAAWVTLAVRRLAPLGRPLAVGREAVPAVILITLGTLTWHQGGTYKDSETLYRSTLAQNPAAWMAHSNLGQLLLGQGKVDDALSHFSAALRLNPNSADAHCNLGAALRAKGELDEAVAQQTMALRIDPNHAEAHTNLGILFLRQGRTAEAAMHLTKAVQVDPQSVEAHRNLGQCLLALGKPEQAIEQFRQTLEVQPTHSEAANNLAWILATNTDEKLRNGTEAVRLAALACGNTDFKNPGMLDTLAAAYAEAGRFDEAIRTARRAVTLADSTGARDLASQVQSRLNLYEQHQPFRLAGRGVRPED